MYITALLRSHGRALARLSGVKRRANAEYRLRAAQTTSEAALHGNGNYHGFLRLVDSATTSSASALG
jgi:hypothetical protein